MPKQYPEEFKKQVVSTYQNGVAIPDLSQRFQISQSTLYRWIKEYVLTGQGEEVINPNML